MLLQQCGGLTLRRCALGPPPALRQVLELVRLGLTRRLAARPRSVDDFSFGRLVAAANRIEDEAAQKQLPKKAAEDYFPKPESGGGGGRRGHRKHTLHVITFDQQPAGAAAPARRFSLAGLLPGFLRRRGGGGSEQPGAAEAQAVAEARAAAPPLDRAAVREHAAAQLSRAKAVAAEVEQLEQQVEALAGEGMAEPNPFDSDDVPLVAV